MSVGGAAKASKRQIFSIVIFNGINYVLIGLPLAVFPGVVHFQLGYGAALAGGVISLQYLATLLTRSIVGRSSDRYGGKSAALVGLGFAAINGLCILAAGFSHAPLVVLGWLMLSRLMLGVAESGTSTGCNMWGVALFGPASMAEVLSWNGVASYGGIAIGAPIGVALMHAGGLRALAAVAIILPLLGFVFAVFRPAAPILASAKRMSMLHVLRYVWPHGLVLACGSFGYGTVVAFTALYYAAHGWHGAAYALTGFGVGFMVIRMFCAGAIGRFGGFWPAILSTALEILGLLILWQASVPVMAFIGAVLTGLGSSLLFPALGVEALKRVDPSSRGAAISIYCVFFDLAFGTTGPIAGFVAGHLGYPAVFLLGAVTASAGVGITYSLYLQERSRAL